MKTENQIQPERSQRFPKACKVQMFNRDEEVWLRAVDSVLRTTDRAEFATSVADEVLRRFKGRFD